MQAPTLHLIAGILGIAQDTPLPEGAKPHDSYFAGILHRLSGRWWSPDLYEGLGEIAISTTFILLFAFAVSWTLDRTVRLICRTLRRRAVTDMQTKKVNTAESILRSVARYGVMVVTTFQVLILWGVPPQSLTVGSAILASAVGFGSQGLIQDMITGFSLLFENQLRVGDFVSINDKTGIVEEVGLRVVKLRSTAGNQFIIFNRQITMVVNLRSGAGEPPSQQHLVLHRPQDLS